MDLNYRELLNARSLSSSDKLNILEAYRSEFNRELNVKVTCRSCYNDAILELINSTKKGYQLCSGVVIKHNGQIYTKHSENLPLDIIELYKHKMIKL
jgi:hypothetical protein